MMGTQSPTFYELSELDEFLAILNNIERVIERAKASLIDQKRNKDLFK